jgi:hypothetical protein
VAITTLYTSASYPSNPSPPVAPAADPYPPPSLTTLPLPGPSQPMLSGQSPTA